MADRQSVPRKEPSMPGDSLHLSPFSSGQTPSSTVSPALTVGESISTLSVNYQPSDFGDDEDDEDDDPFFGVEFSGYPGIPPFLDDPSLFVLNSNTKSLKVDDNSGLGVDFSGASETPSFVLNPSSSGPPTPTVYDLTVGQDQIDSATPLAYRESVVVNPFAGSNPFHTTAERRQSSSPQLSNISHLSLPLLLLTRPDHQDQYFEQELDGGGPFNREPASHVCSPQTRRTEGYEDVGTEEKSIPPASDNLDKLYHTNGPDDNLSKYNSDRHIGDDIGSSPAPSSSRRANSPVIKSHNELRRGEGIRKKNARFDIPAERNLNNIDQLIAQSTDEQEIKELKQQKRLLRNRQAALDSRQRKRLHTERLEDERKSLTSVMADMEEEIDRLKLLNPRQRRMYDAKDFDLIQQAATNVGIALSSILAFAEQEPLGQTETGSSKDDRIEDLSKLPETHEISQWTPDEIAIFQKAANCLRVPLLRLLHYVDLNRGDLKERESERRRERKEDEEDEDGEHKVLYGPYTAQKHITQRRTLVVDEPFTDSGYASAHNNKCYPDSQVHNISENHMLRDEDDTQTTYSAATTIQPHLARQYIIDFCRDVSDKIGQYISDQNWPAVSKSLPNLVKAFAIRIGTRSDELNRNIMRFVHKNHMEIAQQLRVMIQCDDEDTPDISRRIVGAMSILDKMSMWGNKCTPELPEFDMSDLFDGVEEIEDDDINQADVSIYGEAIISSSAYSWFISSLVKECSFQWDTSYSSIMVDNIREVILEQLPTGTISKSRDPDTVKATFLVSFLPLQRRLEQEHSKFANRTHDPLASLRVLTSSSPGQIQVSTIRHYFKQTWTSGGAELLSTFQQAIIDAPGQIPPDAAHDNTEMTAIIERNMLVLQVSGSAYFIAECGEQLSWLVSALQPISLGFITQSTASLKRNAADPSRQGSRGAQDCWVIEIDNNIELDNTCNLESSQISMRLGNWQRQLAQPVIVRGFPIRQRPEMCPGIEASADDLVSLVRSPNLTSREGRVLLRGSNQTLELVKYVDKVLLWHVVGFPDGACSCHRLNPEGTLESLHLIDLAELWQYRHIIGDCRNKQATSTKIRSGVSSTPADGVEDVLVEIQEPFITRSPETSESQNLSLDSDMLSISDVSQDNSFSMTIVHDTFTPIVNAVSNRLLKDFRRNQADRPFMSTYLGSTPKTVVCGRASPSSNSRSVIGNPSFSGFSSSGNTSQSIPIKRPRSSEDDNEAGDDDNLSPPSKRLVLRQQSYRKKALACPYWKLDPLKHKDCFRMKLFEIPRVKQHLIRKHTPEFYCERCKVIFLNEESHEEHLLEPCTLKRGAKLEGISHQQRKKLHGKSAPSLSDSEKWFAMWDIIFPDQSRPPSAYIEPELSEEICQFKEHWQHNGPDVLVEVLQEFGLSVTSNSPETDTMALLRRALSKGLSTIYDGWHSKYRGAGEAAINSRSSRGNITTVKPVPIPHGTPVGSVADSGVAVGSHLASSVSHQAGSTVTGEGDEGQFESVPGLEWTQESSDMLQNKTQLPPSSTNGMDTQPSEGTLLSYNFSADYNSGHPLSFFQAMSVDHWQLE